jgi:hypothetical protein
VQGGRHPTDERRAGFIDSLGAALVQVDYYVGQGNTKWMLLGLAVVLGWIFLKPRR